ncbi:MAG: aminoglycoside phosphotransferase (APT) family kinase protein [Myxococcota bacterium]|jgi:aminoglycoside phosphotransferase (APT) family kinase protein
MTVSERLTDNLRQQGSDARVVSTEPLSGGACQDLFRVVLECDGIEENWVLRSDALTSLPGSISRAEEYPVVRAANAAGVPTPQVRWFGEGIVRDGAGAYMMEWCDGIALGGKVVRHPSLAAAREGLPEQLAQALAAIHGVTPPSGMKGPAEGQGAAHWALSRLRGSLDRLPSARPDLELAYRWLSENTPDDPTGLVHGDFRVGNFLVDNSGLTAVLDWEFTHRGSPFEDMGWLSVRDWRFGVLDKPVGGLCDRARFYAAYEAAGGIAVNPESVHFWEVFGNMSWATGALWQTQRYLDGEYDFELLAIGRRTAEMTYEALRLIERGVWQ